MYIIDHRDHVLPLEDIPQSSVGAPLPWIVADEFTVVVAYYLQDTPPGWDGTTIRIVGPDTPGIPIGVVRFSHAYAHLAGPPNDEAFSGHPLASRGLRPYGAFLVASSSWIRALEQMNAVHPEHRASHFDSYQHFVLTFHDSSVECVAKQYDVRVLPGPMSAVVPAIVALLSSGAA